MGQAQISSSAAQACPQTPLQLYIAAYFIWWDQVFGIMFIAFGLDDVIIQLPLAIHHQELR